MRPCSICGKRRNEAGHCPTPDACEKLKPGYLRKREKAARDKSREAQREYVAPLGVRGSRIRDMGTTEGTRELRRERALRGHARRA